MPDHNAQAKAAYAEHLHDLDLPNNAHLRAEAVANCQRCDDAGYRGSTICDHQDHAPAAARGMQLIRQALQKGTPS